MVTPWIPDMRAPDVSSGSPAGTGSKFTAEGGHYGLVEQTTSKPEQTTCEREQNRGCIIICEIPPDIVATIGASQLDTVLKMCASFCWNPVDRNFNVDQAHRYTVRRSGQIILCYDRQRPSVTYTFDTAPSIAVEVNNFTRRTWRELMNDIREHGLATFLADYKSRQ